MASNNEESQEIEEEEDLYGEQDESKVKVKEK